MHRWPKPRTARRMAVRGGARLAQPCAMARPCVVAHGRPCVGPGFRDITHFRASVREVVRGFRTGVSSGDFLTISRLA